MTDQPTGRRVVAWTSLSLDGCTSGPRGTQYDTWLYEHAGHEQTGAYFESIWRGADTALLGRTNYEGFASVWPGITRDPATDDRTRALGQWLDSVEKVVFSRTLTDAKWENSRIAADLEPTVRELKAAPGRDILVLNSASIIQALLRAGLVDDLRFAVVPTILGGGLRLFSDDLPDSKWRLMETTTLAHGAVGLHYSAEA
ncbi:dihydrofolate reductase family protein [Kribbella sancticallisti]|uniref:Dihydrofolate reductase family protein n=1 Tax=Kribbella sancticallisti TaxID=460087 RepID=A0ABP4PRW8_9ACTN